MGQFNYDILAVQEFSKVTEARIKSLGSELKESRFWSTNFMLNSAFVSNLGPQRIALTFAILRRAEAAIESFDMAAEALAQFVSEKKTLSRYLRILRHLQACIANTWQAIDYARKVGDPPAKVYEANDGTPYERLALVYNASRHGNPLALPEGHLQIDWITNDALHVHDKGQQRTLSFDDLRAIMLDVGGLADSMSSLKFWQRGVPEAT